MATKKPPIYWQGHPVRDEGHSADLDLRSAIHQFHNGLDRASAEAKVKDEDRTERHQKAAAHHIDGMRASNAVGDQESAQQHHGMYGLHMRALGLDANGAVPAEVERHRGKNAEKKVYTFKGHSDDQFLVRPVQKSSTELSKSEDSTCPNCSKKRTPVEMQNNYCGGCAKELDEAKGQAQANMHWQEKPDLAGVGPAAKSKLMSYLQGLGIQGATIEDAPTGAALTEAARSRQQRASVVPIRGMPTNREAVLSVPKTGHLSVVKPE